MSNKIFDERRWSTRYFREQEDTFVNFIAAFVPAIIAFAMVGAAVYLMITAPATPLPNFLANSLTMILGYYFGIGIAQCHNDEGGIGSRIAHVGSGRCGYWRLTRIGSHAQGHSPSGWTERERLVI
jgi:hypothetical protein